MGFAVGEGGGVAGGSASPVTSRIGLQPLSHLREQPFFFTSGLHLPPNRQIRKRHPVHRTPSQPTTMQSGFKHANRNLKAANSFVVVHRPSIGLAKPCRQPVYQALMKKDALLLHPRCSGAERRDKS